MSGNVNTSCGWWVGPENAVDRLIALGVDAIEISYRLELPRWFVLERFAVAGYFEGVLAA